MITPGEITEELCQRGYSDVALNDVVKNGVHFTALTVRSSSSHISPCVYIDDMCRNLSDPAVAADSIENMLRNNPSPLNLDLNQISSREYILENVYIAAQRTSDEELVRRDTAFEGIEEYCYVQNALNEKIWSFKLKPFHLLAAGISTEELWTAAEGNTYSEKEFCIRSMQEILGEMAGVDLGACPEYMPAMYVLSNPRKLRGAVQVFNRPALEKWAESIGFRRFIMIPSSLHEVILIPREESVESLMPLNTMVQDVNRLEVSAEEQLADQVFEFDL